MKISVIVPFWNSEKWLGDCCESLTSQEGDFDFILVDDKSTDNSRDIAYEYCKKDPRFILMTNFRTKGVCGARNTGLEYAVQEKGWITFLDADDELLDNAYPKFTMAIESDKRANIHQFNCMRYYPQIDKTMLKYMNLKGKYHSGKMPMLWFGVWNKLYRAEFLKDIRFDESLQYGEDGLFVLECLGKDDYIHHENSSTVKHRFVNPKSLSKTKTRDDLLDTVHSMEAFMLRQDNVQLREFVCMEISRLWSSTRFRELVACP